MCHDINTVSVTGNLDSLLQKQPAQGCRNAERHFHGSLLLQDIVILNVEENPDAFQGGIILLVYLKLTCFGGSLPVDAPHVVIWLILPDPPILKGVLQQMPSGQHFSVHPDEGPAQPGVVIRPGVYIEFRFHFLICHHLAQEKQIRRHKADFVNGIISPTPAPEFQGACHPLTASYAEYIIAVILVCSPGTFFVSEVQMPVGLKFHFQHGQGKPLSVFNDFLQLALLSLENRFLSKADGDIQGFLPKPLIDGLLYHKKEKADYADTQ